jgi:hypothetical protein
MRSRWVVPVLFAGVVSCGASTPASSDGNSAAVAGGTQKRLQGTWEIVKYQSKEPIPPEAMPLMGSMFEDLRLNVREAAVEVEGKSSPFQAVDENGESFKLRTDGMFNNANCKFTSADEFEVDDQGPTWPGKTILHRSK